MEEITTVTAMHYTMQAAIWEILHREMMVEKIQVYLAPPRELEAITVMPK